ncbi:imelysin family protein [Flavobacteriales bacterium]|nr:imelysin family protein [Flavobacteriales bacterium]
MNRVLKMCFGLLFIATACNTQKDNLVNCDFDQHAMLTNYSDEIIIPRFGELDLGLQFLEASFNAFVANPTPGLLVEVRISFGAAYDRYQRCSTFGFGPGLIDGVAFRARFNTFPTNVSVINSNIENGTEVSASPTSTVGFPALDFLLFGQAGATDAELVALFTTDVNAANRVAYFNQLVSELSTTTNQIIDDWTSYRSTFISNTGTSAGSSISMLVNEFNFDFETLKNFKFKIPLGKFNGGIVLPETVEAFYGGGSIRLAKEQVTGMKNLYLGVGENGADGLGLYDYVLCVKPLAEGEENEGLLALADDVSEQFLEIELALELVPDPLSETLQTNKPVVDDAHTQMQMMVPLIKREMTSALGVQISYQDNDGD